MADIDDIFPVVMVVLFIMAVFFGIAELLHQATSSFTEWPTSSPFDISDRAAYNVSSSTSAYISSLIENQSSTMLATIAYSKYNGSLYLIIYLAPSPSEPPVYTPNVSVTYNGKIAEKIVAENASIFEPVDMRLYNPSIIFHGYNITMYKVLSNTQILIRFPKDFNATGYVVIWYIYVNNNYTFRIASVSEPLVPYINNTITSTDVVPEPYPVPVYASEE